jgi:predicted AAA+ superfamily ATPase
MISRNDYLNWLKGFKDKQLIKIITGIRRCGKSTIMELFIEYLLNNGVSKDQVISINFEDYDNVELKDSKKLHSFIKEKLIPDKMNYIFLDEVQNVVDFPLVVDSLFIRKNVDLYITGSNAYMLSSEIATVLSGRYVTLKMLPLSFFEFMSVADKNKTRISQYTEYVENGAFPYVTNLKGDKKQIYDYLNGIYSTVILKDVAGRYKISDMMMLESIVRFMFHNIGSHLSTKKIADTMTSMNRKIDAKTVEKYINALTDSFILYEAKRYDIKGKQYLKTLEKFYVIDIGMRFMLLGSKSADIGHILENIVFLELIRRGYQVYVGKVDEYEVDFVAESQNGITYFQVAATVRDDETLARELKSLQKITDHYPKFILTLDEDPEADYEGIRRINAIDWLMAKSC